MCDPVTAAVVVGVTAVASSAASAVSQINSANAQIKAINEQRTIVREEARQEATGELFDQMRASRREQAQIRTAAGEAGLGLNSGSIEGMLLDSAMQGELQGSRTIANMESKHRANEAEANSMLSRVSKPTALSAGLQIASAAASGWSGIQSAKISKGDNSPAAYAVYRRQMQDLDAFNAKYGIKPLKPMTNAKKATR